MGLKKIIAISGSTRKYSTNLSLINAIKDLYGDRLEIKIFEGLAEIPHFNPDLNTDNAPDKVVSFRKKLTEAEGILICTPEYAMGVPGTLKNAIDWTVSSMEFSHKPVALITASTLGQKAHQSLLDTLKIIEAKIDESCQLLISHASARIKYDLIIDPETSERVKRTV